MLAHISADAYCETLKKLQRAIQSRKLGMLLIGVVLLHEVLPHVVTNTTVVAWKASLGNE